MKKIVMIVCFIVQTIVAYSQADSPGDSAAVQLDGKWIETTLEQCIKEQGQTNNGMVLCLSEALDAWEKQLQDTYALLYNQIEDSNRTNLKVSQSA